MPFGILIVPKIQDRVLRMGVWSPKMINFLKHPAGPFTSKTLPNFSPLLVSLGEVGNHVRKSKRSVYPGLKHINTSTARHHYYRTYMDSLLVRIEV